MKLQVDQVKEHVGKEEYFENTISPGYFEDVEAYPWSHHDINVNGTYWFDGQNIRVCGKIARSGEYACSRCLQDVDYSDTLMFDETYTELDGDGYEEFYTYHGESIDLSEMIRETLIVNEPYQVLCKEDCKGLCKHCGTDLNEGQCSCEEDEIDPRFAVLRELLKNNEKDYE